MYSQVVSRSIGTAYTLDPAVRAVQLGIPAVGGVVSHLVGHVLTEAHFGVVDTEFEEEVLDAHDEVAQGLVVNDLVLDGFADRHDFSFFAAGQLGVPVQEGEFCVFDILEAVMFLAGLGVDVVFDLGHEELADSQQTLSRGDLVSEGLANGGGGKGHLLLVELEELLEVEELALGRLWAEVAVGLVGAGADVGLEHEVEGLGGVEVGARGWAFDLELVDEVVEAVAVVVVELGQGLVVLLGDGVVELLDLDVLDLLLLLRLVGLLDLDGHAAGVLVGLQTGAEDLLDEMVGPEDLAGLGVLGHEVGELGDVARGDEDGLGGDDGGVDLEHLLLEDEVLAPEVDKVGLQGSEGRAIVEEPFLAAIDLEGGHVEAGAAQQRVEHIAVEGLARLGGVGGSHVVRRQSHRLRFG